MYKQTFFKLHVAVVPQSYRTPVTITDIVMFSRRTAASSSSSWLEASEVRCENVGVPSLTHPGVPSSAVCRNVELAPDGVSVGYRVSSRHQVPAEQFQGIESEPGPGCRVVSDSPFPGEIQDSLLV